MQRKAAQAFSAQRQSTLALLGSLEPSEWEQPCLPPWRVREVVAHLVTVDEAVVTGRMLRLLWSHGRDDIERWNDVAVGLADCSATELLARLERAGARLERRLRRLLRGPLARLPLRTTLGRHPLGFLVCRRVVDEWVHANDIARATGRDAGLGEGVGEALATGTLDALAVATLPRLTERAGVVRLVVETGAPGEPDGPRRVWGIDFARRQYGPRVAARPDATIRLHARDLALLTEGRLATLDPAIEGDEALAARLLKGLAP